MKRILFATSGFFVLITVFLVFSCHRPSKSKDLEYVIVVDAGSSGTRLHLFHLMNKEHLEKNHAYQINESLSVKTTPGISSFVEDVNGLEKNLRPIFDAAQEKLHEYSVDIKSVPLLFYSTAGMRLLTHDQQNKIYSKIRKILDQYEFNVADVKTIEGKTEGLYAWLSVNELSHGFSNETTKGILEMGGASMQIAFELYDDNSNCKETDTISCVLIGGKIHKVFSVSFLGLGQNTALKAISDQQNAGTCYPKDYPNIPNTNGFDFEECDRIFHTILDKAQVHDRVPKHEKNAHFFALSSFGYLADFFDITQPVKQSELTHYVKEKCSNDWDMMQAQCDADQVCRETFRPYMHTYCVLGVYFNSILDQQYYKFTNDDVLYAQTKINGVEPDWPLGAALLYFVTKE